MSRVIDLAALPTDSGIVFPEGTSLNIDSNTLYIDSANDRVGIGTSSPQLKLTVNTGTNQNFNIGGSQTLSDGIRITSTNDLGSSNLGMQFAGSQFVWTSTGTERMRIDSTGKVGIGTSSPSGLLQLSGSTWRKGVLETTGITAKAYQGSDGNGLNFTSNIYWNGSAWVQDDNTKSCFAYIQHLGNSRMEFRVSPAGAFSSWTTAAVITDSGNVGIGKSPSYRLDVNNIINIGTDSTIDARYRFQCGTNAGWVGIPQWDNDSLRIYAPTTTAAESEVASFNASGSNAWIFRTGATTAEKMRIDSSGNVLVGYTASPTTGATGSMIMAKKIAINNSLGVFNNGFLQVNGDADVTHTIVTTYQGTTSSIKHYSLQNPNGIVGSITTSGSATAYNTSSDYRLKENVALMSGSIDRLKQLKPSTWSWTQDGSHGEGFLAHEAQTVVPEAVTGTKDEVDDEGNPVYQGIDQSKLVPLLTAALQEAITKIETLETRIQTLENN